MKYVYKPKKFYLITLSVTWFLWFASAYCSRLEKSVFVIMSMILMFIGLCIPSITSLIFIETSCSKELKQDYKEKLCGIFRINIKNLLFAIFTFAFLIFISILISLSCGESIEQFRFAGKFSFSIGRLPTLVLLLLTAFLEELGWRGYAEDSIAQYCSWFKESIIFGFLWAIWHIPLFFIKGTYQSNILAMNPLYVINFFAGMIPLGFIITWVYVRNNRSIFACSIFHFVVNFLQEQINMTQNTKCIESVVIFMAAILIVAYNNDMFFEKRHVGNILKYKEFLVTGRK